MPVVVQRRYPQYFKALRPRSFPAKNRKDGGAPPLTPHPRYGIFNADVAQYRKSKSAMGEAGMARQDRYMVGQKLSDY